MNIDLGAVSPLQQRSNDTHMMAVEVVGDVRALTGPSLEGMELMLRLRHVGVKEGGCAFFDIDL